MCHGLIIKTAKAVSLFVIFIFFTGYSWASYDVGEFIENFEKNDKQEVLVGHIDSLAIIRGNAEFYLTDGELTLFDFGGGRPCAMVFNGKVRFIYSPPDEIEHYQLKKFTGKDTLDGEFESIVFFFTVELDLPDTTAFIRQEVEKKIRKRIARTKKIALEYLQVNLVNMLIGELLSGQTGLYFLAEFENEQLGKLIYCENPACEDYYRLYKPTDFNKQKVVDIVNGFSTDNNLPSQRGVIPIDITNYMIDAKVDRKGKIKSNCRITYNSLKWGWQYLYFKLAKKNKIIAATDSDGKPLRIIRTKNEPGFGILLNKPLDIVSQDYIDIEYKGKPFIHEWELYYSNDSISWYPENVIPDRATYKMTFKYPSDYNIVTGSGFLEPSLQENKKQNEWIIDKEVYSSGLSFGEMNISESPPKSEVFIRMHAPNKSDWTADLELSRSRDNIFIQGFMGLAAGSVWFDESYKEINNDLLFFKYFLGDCQFNSFTIMETPYSHSRGHGGVIYLSSEFDEKVKLRERNHLLRAHETAHQWWGQTVGVESYRDEWIIEGLAEYCGYLSYKDLLAKDNRQDSTLHYWRDSIMSVNQQAGEVVLGSRLKTSLADDYSNIVIKKGAYIFHMLRFLLHDYDNNSDEIFVSILRELIEKFQDLPITTESLKLLLEKHSNKDFDWFFDQWVYGIHIPTYRFSYDCEQTPDGQYQVMCHVSQKDVPDGFKMVVPLKVVFEDGKFAHLRYWVNQPEQDIQLPPLSLEPKNIDFNIYDAVLCKVKYK